jgi:NADH-quinone oxidoreductase subunit G
MRVWFLKTTPSICTESSVGVNTEVWSREGVIHRITPRRNDAVNDTWMPDSGRLLYKRVTDEKRLVEPRIGGHAATPEAALAAAVELLRSQPGTTAIVGSGRQSVEEQYLTKQLAHALGSVPCDIVGRVGASDGFLLSADRNPNTRGALVTGLLKAYPPPTALTELADAIDHGAVKTVVTFGEDLAAAGLTAERLAKIAIVAVGTRRNPTTDIAKILIPSLTVFEKRGSFLNQQFRLQKFDAAVPGPAQALDDLAILRRLIAGVSGEAAKPAAVDVVWSELAAQVPVLAGIAWSTIPADGRLIDGSAWAREPFVEGETLHFKPAAKPANA